MFPLSECCSRIYIVMHCNSSAAERNVASLKQAFGSLLSGLYNTRSTPAPLMIMYHLTKKFYKSLSQ